MPSNLSGLIASIQAMAIYYNSYIRFPYNLKVCSITINHVSKRASKGQYESHLKNSVDGKMIGSFSMVVPLNSSARYYALKLDCEGIFDGGGNTKLDIHLSKNFANFMLVELVDDEVDS